MEQIPVHLLKDKTDLGLQLKRFDKGVFSEEDESVTGTHRDDHYIFFVIEKGSASIAIDFTDVNIPSGALYYVLPSQVHQRIRSNQADGWFVAVDTGLVPPECRPAFEGRLALQQPLSLSSNRRKQFSSLLSLIYGTFLETSSGTYEVMALHAMLRSFLAIAASCYDSDRIMDVRVTRPAQLTAQFRQLLASEVRTVKSPTQFAERLHVSEAYLTEVLKKTTGFPVTYWIQQEVIMEAKRLLYYSELTVKEVAHDLGYSDASYFSRLFRKVTGQPALAFREQYRK